MQDNETVNGGEEAVEEPKPGDPGVFDTDKPTSPNDPHAPVEEETDEDESEEADDEDSEDE